MFRGDNRVLRTPMTLDKAPWSIPNDATVTCTLRDASDDSVIVAKTRGAGITVATNVFSTAILPADTQALSAPKRLKYDIEMIDVTYGRITVDSGEILLKEDQSRVE